MIAEFQPIPPKEKAMVRKIEKKTRCDKELQFKAVTDLLDAVLRFSHILQPNELYQALAEIVSKRLEADAVAVFIFDEPLRYVRLVFS